MIQRIQTIFLFASLCLIVPMFFLPVANLFYKTGEILTFNLTGFYQTVTGVTSLVSNQPSIMAFGMLICALNLVTIFTFKKRVLQLRLCVYTILLLVGLTGITIYVLYNIQNVETVSFRFAAIFPVIAIIFNFLAFRGIRKDEEMVQATSRLR